MRLALLVTVASMLASGAVLAQTGPSPTQAAPQRPIDNGPNTPQANSAYGGGGVVLQGAPGAPAPTAQPTPPGQAPAGAVKQ